jgi:glycosyltransferase involved in cell wall biosynthesis
VEDVMANKPRKDCVLLLGPKLGAVSGVSAHLEILLRSQLATDFRLEHFAVGSEGRDEGALPRWWRLLTSPFALVAKLRACRPAIVHLNSSLNAGAFWRDTLYMLVAKLLGARVLFQVHGGALPQDFLGHGRWAQALLRRLLSQADAIVVLAAIELAAYRQFLPGRHIRLIANAIECAPLLSLPRAPRMASAPLRLIYLGRLIREKGLYELLQGLAETRAHGIDARLTVVGSGPEAAGLRRRALELGLAAAVSFTGAAFGATKAHLLGEADVFVLPSYHPEGLPYALLEGMAAGNAVITTRIGGIPDVALPDEHAVFVPPRDTHAIAAAIAHLATDAAGLAHMSAACRHRIARHYSPERLVQEFGALYADLQEDSRKICAA